MGEFVANYGVQAVVSLIAGFLVLKAIEYVAMWNSAARFARAAAEEIKKEKRLNDGIEARNRACNLIYDAGMARFLDFEIAVDNFSTLGGATDSFLDCIVSLNPIEAAEHFYYLGKNPAEASRVMRLPPSQIQDELASGAALRNSSAARVDLPTPKLATRESELAWVPPLSPEPSTGRALILLLLLVIHAALWIVWLWITGVVVLLVVTDRAQTNMTLAGVAIWIAGAWAGWHIAGLPRRWAYSSIYGESDRLRMLAEKHLEPPPR